MSVGNVGLGGHQEAVEATADILYITCVKYYIMGGRECEWVWGGTRKPSRAPKRRSVSTGRPALMRMLFCSWPPCARHGEGQRQPNSMLVLRPARVLRIGMDLYYYYYYYYCDVLLLLLLLLLNCCCCC